RRRTVRRQTGRAGLAVASGKRQVAGRKGFLPMSAQPKLEARSSIIATCQLKPKKGVSTMRLLSGQMASPPQVKTDSKRSRQAAKDETPAIPPDPLLRRDHNIRYERNGAVYATDGKVGSLKKVVVDEGVGEVVELVVAVEGQDRSVLLPPDLVDKTAGSAVFLTINRIQFTD